jgi:GTPase SAR1 family protein
MIDKYEYAYSSLLNLIQEFEATEKNDFNEATTRFRFIDRILTECLAWEHKDITTEDSYEGEYSDYTLHLFRPVAVLEAKRTGNYFEIPVGVKSLVIPIKILIKDNSNIKPVLNQISGYCNARGIQIGIISNGWQLIAFIANRTDSIPPLNGEALVIPSLQYFYDNFREVWNCLSKVGLEEQYLYKKLLGGGERQIPPKLSSMIYDYPGIKNRNPFQTELEIISDLVLEDVIKDKSIEKEFLQDCYCKSGAISNYSLVSKEMLTTRYNYLFEGNDRKATLNQVTTKKGVSPELMELFANSLSKRPILLIGDVGAGKSTFINNLLIVEAPKVFEKSLTFRIDLGSKAIITLDVRMAIIEEIIFQLQKIYKIDIEDDNFVRHCYFLDLEKFKRSIHVKRLYEIDPNQAVLKEIEFLSSLVNDSINHLKKSLEFISKNQKKQIIIFIDNCDQRSDQDQEISFLVSQEFATEWPVVVFICLRPETFHRTKKSSGALSGYHTKAFTIPPPRIDEVLIKRLEFAQKITSGEITLSRLENTTTFSKLHTLIQIVINSLEYNRELFKFLDNISNSNIRKAIELLKKFIGSGHVDTEKILRIYEDDGKYLIPIHELLRSVIYGDNIHFSPEKSEIVNLFEVRNYDPKEHFIALLLIGILYDYSSNNRNHGFVELEHIYSLLQSLGYTSDQIDSCLNFMYSKGLFETSQKGNLLKTDDTTLLIRATNLAIYHFSYLIGSFTYIDAVLVDVPIFFDDYRGKIINTYDVKDRLKRAGVFKSYLDKVWENMAVKDFYFNWELKSNELGADINRIMERVLFKNNS